MKSKHPCREVDLSAWKRARHYRVYAAGDFPFVGITAELDITRWDAGRRRSGRKFFPAFLQTVMLAMAAIENFRYRINGGKVLVCEQLVPAFVVFEPEEELHYYAAADLCANPEVFDRRVEEAKLAALTSRCLDEGMLDYVFVSCLPWFGFTDVLQPLGLKSPDSIPRVVWGRFRRDGDAVTIPFSITAHHGLVDGVHIGKLFAAIEGREWEKG